MEWRFIVVLILIIPVILFPVVGLWYINIGRIGQFTRAARRRQIDRKKETRSVTTEQTPATHIKGETHNTYTLSEKVYKDLEEILATAYENMNAVATAVMPEIPDIDDEGYMAHPEAWTEEIAEHLAQDLVPGGLTEEHWRVIHYLREYYLKFGSVPPVRMLCRDTRLSLKRIYELFPGNLPRGLGAGLAKCACKIAGIPWLSYKQYP